VAVALAVVCAAPGHAAETRPVDATLAVVGDTLVSLSDVTLARALGLFGLVPSEGPVTDADVDRYLDSQLEVREAAQLEIDVPAADVDRVWQAAGGAALARRLEAVGVDPAWARRLVEADLRGRRLLELHVRAFAFVTEVDVEDAMGTGPRDEATRARTRARLEAEAVARAVADWREEARGRIRMRRIPIGEGPWPPPFSLR
jgi:pyruvate/2-oxoglutarate dehydrogenase complex dihydrolipoamide acyltransferase (E2) component